MNGYFQWCLVLVSITHFCVSNAVPTENKSATDVRRLNPRPVISSKGRSSHYNTAHSIPSNIVSGNEKVKSSVPSVRRGNHQGNNRDTIIHETPNDKNFANNTISSQIRRTTDVNANQTERRVQTFGIKRIVNNNNNNSINTTNSSNDLNRRQTIQMLRSLLKAYQPSQPSEPSQPFQPIQSRTPDMSTKPNETIQSIRVLPTESKNSSKDESIIATKSFNWPKMQSEIRPNSTQNAKELNNSSQQRSSKIAVHPRVILNNRYRGNIDYETTQTPEYASQTQRTEIKTYRKSTPLTTPLSLQNYAIDEVKQVLNVTEEAIDVSDDKDMMPSMHSEVSQIDKNIDIMRPNDDNYEPGLQTNDQTSAEDPIQTTGTAVPDTEEVVNRDLDSKSLNHVVNEAYEEYSKELSEDYEPPRLMTLLKQLIYHLEHLSTDLKTIISSEYQDIEASEKRMSLDSLHN